MGDDEACPSLHQLIECFLDPDFSQGIDAGCRFVQDQDRRQAKHNPRDAQQLLLPGGESIFRYPGIQSFRKSSYEAPAVCLFACGNDFLIRCIGLAEGDVLADRPALQPGILQHHAILLAQRMPGDFRNVRTVDGNLSVIDIIEAHEQVDQCCLAAAGRADDGNVAARLYIQCEILNQRLILDVAEIDIVNFDSSFASLDQSFLFSRFRFCFDQFKYACCTCQRILEFRHH